MTFAWIAYFAVAAGAFAVVMKMGRKNLRLSAGLIFVAVICSVLGWKNFWQPANVLGIILVIIVATTIMEFKVELLRPLMRFLVRRSHNLVARMRSTPAKHYEDIHRWSWEEPRD